MDLFLSSHLESYLRQFFFYLGDQEILENPEAAEGCLTFTPLHELRGMERSSENDSHEITSVFFLFSAFYAAFLFSFESCFAVFSGCYAIAFPD